MAPPSFDENLGFLEGVEYLTIQELVAQSGIETLDVAVLPGRSRLDEGGAGPDCSDPPPDGFGDELRAVVGTDPSRDAAQDEQVGQHVDDVNGGKLPAHPDRQALAGELVQDVEHAEGPAVMGLMMDEVIGPDVVRPLGTQPDAGAVVQPQTVPLRLFLGHLQPLAPPQALDPLVVDLPAGDTQQGRDAPIAVAAILAGQLGHVRNQAILVGTAVRDATDRIEQDHDSSSIPRRQLSAASQAWATFDRGGGARKFLNGSSRFRVPIQWSTMARNRIVRVGDVPGGRGKLRTRYQAQWGSR